jgi:murein DD-endopeptidase MepM/ murein hydrolase activator NlpD
MALVAVTRLIASSAMLGAICPRCRGQVALYNGRPRITASGAIELWCAPCAEAPPDEAPSIIEDEGSLPAIVVSTTETRARRRRAPSMKWMGLVGAGVFTLAIVKGSGSKQVAAAAVVPVASDAILADADGDGAVTQVEISHEVKPPKRVLPLPAPAVASTEELDAKFASLKTWVHPVVDSPEPVPHQESRWFGMPREGITNPRPECGAGHCGIDLDGPRGNPVVAVAPGTVVRIERSELGRDGKSGRYVRIEHDDGTLTAYMHLDDIADGLVVGQRVVAGQQVGTLGATAVYRAAPHLHFSLAVPEHGGAIHEDNNDNHYVDPMPFLARARVIDEVVTVDAE